MLKWRRSELGLSEADKETRSGVDSNPGPQQAARESEMCGECTDSGREATDSASLTSSQPSNVSSGCSACTDTSAVPRSEASSHSALKVPNARRRPAADRQRSDSLEGHRRLQRHSGVWGSAEHLASEEDNQHDLQHVHPVRKTSSVDDLLETSDRPVRGILRRRGPDRYGGTPSRPRFVFSRYNPQFRTLPTPRRGQQTCWPPADLPVQKSFLSLQKFRRRERGRARESRAARPTAADIAVLRHDLLEEARSLGYLSATELGDVRYFSHKERSSAPGAGARLISESGADERTDGDLPRLKDIPPERRAVRQQRQLAAELCDVMRRPTPPLPAQQGSSRAPSWSVPLPGVAEEEERQLETLLDELVNTPPSLKRWYQAVSAARRLGLILPLYRGLHDRLDPVTLAKLLFKGRHHLMRATEEHSSEDPALLSFPEEAVLRVFTKHRQHRHGWWFGAYRGRHGVFPCRRVVPLSRGWYSAHHQPVSDLEHGNAEEPDAWIAEPLDEERQGAESDGDSSNHSQDSANHSQGSGSAVDDGKHSLLQFAMTNFRGAEERYNLVKDEDGAHSKMLETKNKKNKKKGKEDWTWREQVELVKWTDRPLRVSLLKLSPPELTRLAVESFSAIQRYMGDQTLPREVTDVDCVYTVLMACHRYPALRDEVYCQLMRQTTSNRSSQADSCARGWRLLSLVAAFFPCSESLRPYLQKYLETTAQDPRRAHRGTAAVSLQNLRQTLRLGGRRNVPSEEEIAAVTAGCTARRQRYLLPGGTQRIVNTRCTTVVQNVLVELCRELGVTTEDELEEFSLYCVVEGDAFTLPLARHEYVLDVTTELERNEQMFHLVLCRTVWSLPLRLDSAPYLDVLFSQVTPDYLEGLLLVLPAETLPQSVVFDIARVAALLHRSAGLRSMPTIKETKHLLPKAALLVRDIKPPQWVNMVQDSWSEVQDKTPAEARRAVLETLRGWPLFGSAFFVVGAAPESRGEAATDRLLAVNSSGLHLLDTVTHETQSQYPFSEVLSTRRVRSDAGDLYIDVKVGTPKQAKVIRMQTENAAEIARLIRQYSAAQQRSGPMAERAAEPRERQVSR
ncbi:unconventional myosin-XV-like isoform X2 [Amphibalanus amphitrite]|uniref:unconventional myosin-XV-like isoform X2 n=1 Tax=Amphibalanus amphitrite TaxID=1232801 RepID=UPI001C8FDDE3|nr:unconventional myosin-XV-like isoform X2 [Amphibalanus amphitrite]